MTPAETVLELRELSKSYAVTPTGLRWPQARGAQAVRAVDRVSLVLQRGEMLALVGESGCGKSTLARMAVGLLPADSGERITAAPPLAIQMIFQDAAAALNPRLRVQELLAEAPRVHGLIRRGEENARVAEWLDLVGLDAGLASRFPHQLSGGQKARVGIARALAVQPAVLVCDEILASLDVLLQAQIMRLLRDLQQRLGLACLFISHDLAVVQAISDRVAVMYRGRIIESAPTAQLFAEPRHPYTRTLLAAMPSLSHLPRVTAISESSTQHPLTSCHFQKRCPEATEQCALREPTLLLVGSGHAVACHLYSESKSGSA